MKQKCPVIVFVILLMATGLHADEAVGSSNSPLSKKERLKQCQSAVQTHFEAEARCSRQICTRCFVKKGKSTQDWQARLRKPEKCFRKIVQQTKACKIVLSPQALYEEYKSNPAVVDEKYKGKTVVIKGVLKELAETPNGIPFANLKAGKYGIKRVVLFASEQHQQKMISKKKGAKIFAICRGGGKYVVYPRLNDCIFL